MTSRLSLRTKLGAAFGVTLLLLVAAAAVAVTRMDSLSHHTADAKVGAVLDEQIMSMEIAVREALDVEAESIVDGHDDELDARLAAAWERNDGDAFAESLAEAQRLAVLDMPSRLEADAAAAAKVRESIAATVGLVRDGDLAGARANRDRVTEPAFEAFVEANQSVETQSEEFSEAAATGAASIATSGKRTIVIVTLLGAALRRHLRVLITRGISRGVAQVLDRLGLLRDHCTTDLATGLSAVADGDLTRTVTPVTPRIDAPGGDEIGQVAAAVNEIRDNTVASVDAYNRDARAALGRHARAVGERRHRVVGLAADGRDLRGGRPRGGRDRLRDVRRRGRRRAPGAHGRVDAHGRRRRRQRGAEQRAHRAGDRRGGRPGAAGGTRRRRGGRARDGRDQGGRRLVRARRHRDRRAVGALRAHRRDRRHDHRRSPTRPTCWR